MVHCECQVLGISRRQLEQCLRDHVLKQCGRRLHLRHKTKVAGLVWNEDNTEVMGGLAGALTDGWVGEQMRSLAGCVDRLGGPCWGRVLSQMWHAMPSRDADYSVP